MKISADDLIVRAVRRVRAHHEQDCGHKRHQQTAEVVQEGGGDSLHPKRPHILITVICRPCYVTFPDRPTSIANKVMRKVELLSKSFTRGDYRKHPTF